MKQVTADIAETRAKKDAEQVVNELERQRLRQEQGKYLHDQYTQAVAEYERIRGDAHAIVGRVWIAAQAYSRLTGQNPNEFPENTFNDINLPTLKPNPSPYGMSSAVSTTRGAVMGWFASTGTRWE